MTDAGAPWSRASAAPCSARAGRSAAAAPRPCRLSNSAHTAGAPALPHGVLTQKGGGAFVAESSVPR